MRLRLLSSLALFALVLGVFSPVYKAEFLNYDDNEYVSANPMVQRGLDGTSLRWAFSESHSSNWHPLTWIAHMLDVEIFGATNAGAHHLSNVLVHAAAAVALAWLGFALTGLWWPSLFVAALFAVHPLHVESVAWISERKDTLSALLAFLCLIAYTRYARARTFSPGRYALTTVLFVLGLLAKPMLVTLPAVMLLLDRWPLRRTTPWKWSVLEKLPWMALVVGSILVTLNAQDQGGSLRDTDLIPIGDRLQNATLSIVVYLRQLVWPSGLSIFYPHWALLPEEVSPGPARITLAMVLVTGLTFAAAIVSRRTKSPATLTGWLLFLGMLIPVIGFVQVGLQAHADRYTYLPFVGLFLIVTAGLRSLAARSPRSRRSAVLVGAAALVACSTLSYRQSGYWKSSTTLFTRALEVTGNNWIAHLNLSQAAHEAGDLQGAALHVHKARAIQPRDPLIHFNAGNIERDRGDLEAARQSYETALELDPTHAGAANNLGDVLARQGDFEAAAQRFRQAIEFDPDFVAARRNLCRALLIQGRATEARLEAEELLRRTGSSDRNSIELFEQARRAESGQ